MASLKSTKRRIASVGTTKKIMRAMNLVAASRLQRDKLKLQSAQDYIASSLQLLALIGKTDFADKLVYFNERQIENTAYFIITSDRGLCGNYNNNLCNLVLQHLDTQENELLVISGLRGYEFFRKRGKNIYQQFEDVMETAYYHDAKRVATLLMELYSSRQADAVYIAYTRFSSILSHQPTIEKVLPLSANGNSAVDKQDTIAYLASGDLPNEVINRYLIALIYRALLEASTCEQAARMLSMDAAVNNADDIIAKLSRNYNRRRQAAITQEISEIIGSASI